MSSWKIRTGTDCTAGDCTLTAPAAEPSACSAVAASCSTSMPSLCAAPASALDTTLTGRDIVAVRAGLLFVVDAPGSAIGAVSPSPDAAVSPIAARVPSIATGERPSSPSVDTTTSVSPDPLIEATVKVDMRNDMRGFTLSAKLSLAAAHCIQHQA